MIKERIYRWYVCTLLCCSALSLFASCNERPKTYTLSTLDVDSVSVSAADRFPASAIDDILQHYAPGDTVPVSAVEKAGAKSFFSSTSIPDTVFAQMRGKSFKANCTVPRESLRYLRCLHVDKDGRIIVGEMVVNKKVAADVLDIFYQLYQAKYPIERMRLIDHWDADDERAMRDNNSSSFNFRFISHTRTVSKHGKGTAIDINTLYNPYHKRLRNGREVVEPATGRPYLDRTKNFAYKIVKGDLCYRLFKSKGFVWGGDWTNRKDYQHFELP